MTFTKTEQGQLLTDAALLSGRCTCVSRGQTVWTLLTLPAVRLVPVPPHRAIRAVPALGQLLAARAVVCGWENNALKQQNLQYAAHVYNIINSCRGTVWSGGTTWTHLWKTAAVFELF